MLCLECGAIVRSINYRHLRSCSGVTPREYRLRHPGAELMDGDVRTSCGLPLERNPKWAGGRTFRRCAECNRCLSKGTRGERCVNCRQWCGEHNPFYGRMHSAATRARMVAAAKHRNRATYVGRKFTSEEVSQQQRRYWSRLSDEDKARRLATFIAAGQKYNKKNSKTAVEMAVARVLDEAGVRYRQNVQLGRYNVDFLLDGAVIVECYGDFWHCNPEVYPPGYFNRSLHMSAQEKWQKDAARVHRIRALGYSVYVVWERTVRTGADAVRRELAQVLGWDSHHANDERRRGVRRP